MKKIIKTLLMLTCVFVLTACGSSDGTMSDFQKTKVDEAQKRAQQVVGVRNVMVSTGDVDGLLANYSNVELGDVFTSTYSQYFSDYSFACEGKAVNGALTSFRSGQEAMGSIQAGKPVSVVDDDTIIVTVPVTGGNASGSVELIFTNDIYLKMTSCTLNMDETKGQLMTKAALNTLLALGTVFVVLILISIIISAFGLIPKLQASLAPKKNAAIPAPAAAPTPAPVVQEEELSDDMELVAVIAAAIAAYEGTSVEGFQVRSIKRANTNKWKRS